MCYRYCVSLLICFFICFCFPCLLTSKDDKATSLNINCNELIISNIIYPESLEFQPFIDDMVVHDANLFLLVRGAKLLFRYDCDGILIEKMKVPALKGVQRYTSLDINSRGILLSHPGVIAEYSSANSSVHQVSKVMDMQFYRNGYLSINMVYFEGEHLFTTYNESLTSIGHIDIKPLGFDIATQFDAASYVNIQGDYIFVANPFRPVLFIYNCSTGNVIDVNIPADMADKYWNYNKDQMLAYPRIGAKLPPIIQGLASSKDRIYVCCAGEDIEIFSLDYEGNMKGTYILSRKNIDIHDIKLLDPRSIDVLANRNGLYIYANCGTEKGSIISVLRPGE